MTNFKGILMKWKIAALSMLMGATAQAAECGKVTIADMNWSSASFIANVDQFILSNGFGCDAELVPGDTMPTITSMVEKSQPDIAPEIWSNSAKEVLDKAIKEEKLVYAGDSLSDGGNEGFWVPAYLVAQYPELKTIEGVKKHPELFKHPEDPEVGGFYGCPAGWNCQISAVNLFKALELEKSGFEIIDPGSSAGLSGSIAKAYERKEGWFGYYWAPTALLGKYDMVKVDFGTGVDEEEFLTCTAIDGCKDPKVTMYPKAPVATMVTAKFAPTNPDVVAYLSKRSFTNDEMNKLLAWMEDEQATAEDAMYYFLEAHPEKWKAWLPADVAGKVAAKL